MKSPPGTKISTTLSKVTRDPNEKGKVTVRLGKTSIPPQWTSSPNVIVSNDNTGLETMVGDVVNGLEVEKNNGNDESERQEWGDSYEVCQGIYKDDLDCAPMAYKRYQFSLISLLLSITKQSPFVPSKGAQVRSCEFCRSKKLKCGRGFPCHNCNIRDHDCIYLERKSRRRTGPGSYTKGACFNCRDRGIKCKGDRNNPCDDCIGRGLDCKRNV